MADVKKLAEELVNLKVTEVNELATISKRNMALNRLLPLLPLQLPLPAQARLLLPRIDFRRDPEDRRPGQAPGYQGR